MRNIRVVEEGDFAPLPGHYIIRKDAKTVRTYEDGPDEIPRDVVALDYKVITDMLTHHIGAFERGGPTVNIDGFAVPTRLLARVYIDAMHTLLGNHGVIINRPQVREDLCSTCIGSAVPHPDITNEKPMIPEGVTHG